MVAQASDGFLHSKAYRGVSSWFSSFKSKTYVDESHSNSVDGNNSGDDVDAQLVLLASVDTDIESQNGELQQTKSHDIGQLIHVPYFESRHEVGHVLVSHRGSGSEVDLEHVEDGQSDCHAESTNHNIIIHTHALDHY